MKTTFLLSILITLFPFEYASSQTWTSVGTGTNNDIFCLQTDTVNNLLYAGGYFTTAGSTTVSCIAVWNGVSWNSLGSGVSGINGQVRAMAIYNGELYAGGHFTLAGGLAVTNIAKWNGASWSDVGAGVNSSAYIDCFAEYNSELYVGGYFFTTAGATLVNNIAKWNGTNWSDVGSGVSSGIQALSVFNGELYAAGDITQAGGVSVNNITKWNGTSWSDVNGGLNSTVFTLCAYNNELYAGGNFSVAGVTPAYNIAKWNGIAWDSVSTGIDWMVDALTVYDGSLYAGGLFWNAGGVPVNNIANWDGLTWSAIGAGIPDISGNTTPIVRALTEYNSCLHVGGIFNISTGSPANYISKWDCGTLSTSEDIKNNSLNISPNPFNFETIIKVDDELKNSTLILYNSLGIKVKQIDNIFGKIILLERDNLSDGLYFIQISRDNKVYKSEKIVISRPR